MADLPIPFSAPMIRAILREIEQPGTGKTQTRRVLTPQLDDLVEGQTPRQLRTSIGDRLYVREAHHRTNDHAHSHLVGYDFADGPIPRKGRHHIEGVGYVEFFHHSLGGWGGRLSRNYPAMHMPRWASRITLIVTDVRVQRLQEISEADAVAEGLIFRGSGNPLESGWCVTEESQQWPSAVFAYSGLWESLNADRGYGWETNPWVAAYTFRPILGNIDQVQHA